jgi:hypothetical protein
MKQTSLHAHYQACACPCGKSTFEVKSKPIARLICHCTICQSLYKRPFADFTVLRADQVEFDKTQNIQFGRHRLPPSLNRGLCGACQAPTLGFIRVAPYLNFAFVPSSHYPEQDFLPPASAHIFYHSRVTDIDDNLPKHNGYWTSELIVGKAVLTGLFH